MRRREFIELLGCGAAWSHVARSQSAMPVIDCLHSGSPVLYTSKCCRNCRRERRQRQPLSVLRSLKR